MTTKKKKKEYFRGWRWCLVVNTCLGYMKPWFNSQGLFKKIKESQRDILSTYFSPHPHSFL
jgi:hypothetical protein